MKMVPAISMKEKLIEEFDKLRYDKKAMYYNGTAEHGRLSIRDEWDNGGDFQWAVIDDSGELAGYIAYYVDMAARSAYSFGIIAFDGDWKWQKKSHTKAMSKALIRTVHELTKMKLHRIEWRAVRDNPATRRYMGIAGKAAAKYYWLAIHVLNDVFIDEYGTYHDSVIFELLERKEEHKNV